MDRFVQIHLLTAYPPSNPNRDDLGRPKTAIVGGAQRQRISSQALKRALRENEAFADALKGKLGSRTQRLGTVIVAHLTAKGAADDVAVKIARDIAAAFGKIKDEKSKDSVLTEQLAFISPDEKNLALALADKALAGEKLPGEKDLAKTVLLPADGAVDIAMFGRMLAGNPDYNRDAAVQIAHAITTNKVDVEDDFYTAVDDLKTAETDAGAGFVGEAGFGSGVYYVYACVNSDLLAKNLDGDMVLAKTGMAALVRALSSATPGGKKNSFAHHVRPEFMLVERGDGQPLNLFSAFATPISGTSQMESSIKALKKARANFADAYGQSWTSDMVLEVGAADTRSIDDLAVFAAAALDGVAS
jgi:CRISPR system Cascade subunit CasC